MNYRISVYDADPALGLRVQRCCDDFFSRRPDSCTVAVFTDPLRLEQAAQTAEFDLCFFGLDGQPSPTGLRLARLLRQRLPRTPFVFLARSTAHAYAAYRVDALQYFTLPLSEDEVFRLLTRVVEPEYGPSILLATPAGRRLAALCDIEYAECTQHIIHLHLTGGETVSTLSQRAPFPQVMAPLLADPRFVQPHRSYILNLAAVKVIGSGEVLMQSGDRIPLPREREAAVLAACRRWQQYQAERTAIPSDEET